MQDALRSRLAGRAAGSKGAPVEQAARSDHAPAGVGCIRGLSAAFRIGATRPTRSVFWTYAGAGHAAARDAAGPLPAGCRIGMGHRPKRRWPPGWPKRLAQRSSGCTGAACAMRRPLEEWIGGAIGFFVRSTGRAIGGEAARVGTLLQLLRERRCLVNSGQHGDAAGARRSEGSYRDGYSGSAHCCKPLPRGGIRAAARGSRERHRSWRSSASAARAGAQLSGLGVREGQALRRTKELFGG